MAFEKMRGIWTRMQQPIVDRLGGVDPAVLTWMSLVFNAGALWLLATTGRGEGDGWRFFGALVLVFMTAEMDSLDGAVARTFDKVSKYGDFLDHSIDRIVDLSILIAIGMNAIWMPNAWLGWSAATITLLGSYMGTQAQSVGLGRNYGGFSRADRMVTTVVGIFIAGLQAMLGWGDLALPSGIADATGIPAMNGLTFILIVCWIGGLYTTLLRAVRARRGLLAGEADEA